ncbi:hypothetical protein IFM89_039259 [Coptis chinensis]|uniref:Lariat debranching enzyme C-terminal domain-containing protein n=1 Tax=Coptis chinensis TaxID=261450 RepID=A0A835MBS1_9MAGN|nr:hypothetical protein IFM89_039259 [Coptis chinensis]
MRIAVEGCMHGDLDNVYATLSHLEKVDNKRIDLLICCGDFQAVRNEEDLKCVAAPEKYLKMNSFWKYYSGQQLAPVPTVFIGGNHEASNYLWELYYGGWAAPNIYFLGSAGVIKFGNIRIGGLSGIYNKDYYNLGHYERVPYNDEEKRSVYYEREYDVSKLMQVKEPIDIFLSHDWPLNITDYGNWREILQQKKNNLRLESDICNRKLGSKPAAELLHKLKPLYWFSAHIHCKFAAAIQHGEGGPVTKFLALDKCLPGRSFLQVFEIDSEPGPYEIRYDEEWLAITRKFNSVFPLTRKPAQLWSIQSEKLQDHLEWVRSKLKTRGTQKPFEFVQTAPPYDPYRSVSQGYVFSGHCRNPQTESLLELLELPYLLNDALQPQNLVQPMPMRLY